MRQYFYKYPGSAQQCHQIKGLYDINLMHLFTHQPSAYIFDNMSLIFDFLDISIFYLSSKMQSLGPDQPFFNPELSEQIEWILLTSDCYNEQVFRDLIQKIHRSCQDAGNDGQAILQIVYQLGDQIYSRTKRLAQNCSHQLQQLKVKFSEQQNHIHQQKQVANSQNELINSLNKEIKQWKQEYEHLQLEHTEMQEKYQIRLREAKREKKQIKQTFRQVQENTELQRALLENLQLQKLQINQQIQEKQKQNEHLRDQIKQLRKLQVKQEQVIEASASKRSWQQKRIAQLQQQLLLKESAIKNLKIKIQELLEKYELKEKSDKRSQHNNLAKSFVSEPPVQQVKKYVSFIESFKLSDEIMNINEDFELRSRKSAIMSMRRSIADSQKDMDPLQINKSFIQPDAEEIIPDQQAKKSIVLPVPQKPIQKINIPDFYLAHFLLTCQAIKLKMARQEYLSIDLTMCYSQVVRERVPFHLWDDWIKDKLNKLAPKY